MSGCVAFRVRGVRSGGVPAMALALLLGTAGFAGCDDAVLEAPDLGVPDVGTQDAGQDPGQDATPPLDAPTDTTPRDPGPGDLGEIPASPVLVGLRVAPETAEVAVGMTTRLAVWAVYDDDSELDMTEDADWSSAAPEIAQVSILAGERGTVTGIGIGEARINVVLGDQAAHATVDVVEAQPTALAIEPESAEVIVNLVQAFQAAATYENGTQADVTDQVAWQSADESKLIFLDGIPAGRALALAPGVVGILAVWADRELQGEATVTVVDDAVQSLALEPASLTLVEDTSGSFQVRATFESGAQSLLGAGVLWSSSNEAVATVSGAAGGGQVLAVAPGTATITAQAAGKSATGDVTVRAATLKSLTVLPAEPTLAMGARLQFQAVGHLENDQTQDMTRTVAWSSSDDAVIKVSDALLSKGSAAAGAYGDAEVRVAYKSLTGSAPVHVRLRDGDLCKRGDSECASGICAQPDPDIAKGYCCPTKCAGGCQDCASGTCKPIVAGTDPYTACDDYTCNGKGACYTSCMPDRDNCSIQCKGWCKTNTCVDKLARGGICVGNCQCQSGTCLLGRCM